MVEDNYCIERDLGLTDDARKIIKDENSMTMVRNGW